MNPLFRQLKGTKVFIDTCSLMHPKVKDCIYRELGPALADVGAKLIVPHRVYEELERKRLDEGDGPDVVRRRQLAANGIEVLRELQKTNLLVIIGEPNDQFPDALFHYIFSQYRRRYPLCLITQDVGLMRDILQLGNSMSVGGIKPISVWTIGKEGLENVTLDDVNARLSRRHRNQQHNGSKADFAENRRGAHGVRKNDSHRPTIKYRVAQQMRPLNQTVIPITVKLAAGAVLRTQQGEAYTLREKLSEGGEGIVYATSDPNKVAKIYLDNRLTRDREEKLTLMVSRGIDDTKPESRAICWPTDLLYDQAGTFRGYLMKKAAGVPLNQAVFIRSQLEEMFPHWNRGHLIELCLTVMRSIRFLHDSNIIIGDINPNNILVEDEKNVYFVDTDSYQLEGFPCPVGTVHFTPPELQGVDFSTRLRTKEHEAFAVATLLFMIIHAGKQPYAQLGGGTPAENIRRMEFPYPNGPLSNRRAPEGPWKYIWSHLPRRMKEAFYQTFDKSGRGKPRPTADDWIELLERYVYRIRKGQASDELFPTQRKQVPLSKLGEKVEQIKCKECGRVFYLVEGEKNSFLEKGLAVPKRCKNCRANRKGLEAGEFRADGAGVSNSNGRTHGARGTRSVDRGRASHPQADQAEAQEQSIVSGIFDRIRRLFFR